MTEQNITKAGERTHQTSKTLRNGTRYIYTRYSYGHSRCLVLDESRGLFGIKAQTVLSRSRKPENQFHRCGDHVRVIWAV